MNQLNLKNWVRDRILFLGLVIFVIGAAGYIGAEKMVGPHSPWIHPIREFSLLISMVGVVSLGYEVFLRELSFKEYKEALEEKQKVTTGLPNSRATPQMDLFKTS